MTSSYTISINIPYSNAMYEYLLFLLRLRDFVLVG